MKPQPKPDVLAVTRERISLTAEQREGLSAGVDRATFDRLTVQHSAKATDQRWAQLMLKRLLEKEIKRK